MFTQATLDFLSDLSANNSRDWFSENKPRYEADLKAPAAAYMEAMKAEIDTRTGLAHATRLFRIHRDLRFSKDKTPYNTHVHISFVPRDAAGVAPAWMMGLSGSYFTLGCGAFAFDKPGLERFRETVAGEDGVAIAQTCTDLAAGGVRLSEPDLKRVPTPYDRDHPRADLLRHKGLAGWIDHAPGQGLGQNGLALSVAGFERLEPLFAMLRGL